MASWWNVMNRPDKLSPFSICLFQPEQITIFFPHLSILTGVDGTMGVAGVVGRSVSSGWSRDLIRRKRFRPSRGLSVAVLAVPGNADFRCQAGFSRVEASI